MDRGVRLWVWVILVFRVVAVVFWDVFKASKKFEAFLQFCRDYLRWDAQQRKLLELEYEGQWKPGEFAEKFAVLVEQRPDIESGETWLADLKKDGELSSFLKLFLGKHEDGDELGGVVFKFLAKFDEGRFKRVLQGLVDVGTEKSKRGFGLKGILPSRKSFSRSKDGLAISWSVVLHQCDRLRLDDPVLKWVMGKFDGDYQRFLEASQNQETLGEALEILEGIPDLVIAWKFVLVFDRDSRDNEEFVRGLRVLAKDVARFSRVVGISQARFSDQNLLSFRREVASLVMSSGSSGSFESESFRMVQEMGWDLLREQLVVMTVDEDEAFKMIRQCGANDFHRMLEGTHFRVLRGGKGDLYSIISVGRTESGITKRGVYDLMKAIVGAQRGEKVVDELFGFKGFLTKRSSLSQPFKDGELEAFFKMASQKNSRLRTFFSCFNQFVAEGPVSFLHQDLLGIFKLATVDNGRTMFVRIYQEDGRRKVCFDLSARILCGFSQELVVEVNSKVVVDLDLGFLEENMGKEFASVVHVQLYKDLWSWHQEEDFSAVDDKDVALACEYFRVMMGDKWRLGSYMGQFLLKDDGADRHVGVEGCYWALFQGIRRAIGRIKALEKIATPESEVEKSRWVVALKTVVSALGGELVVAMGTVFQKELKSGEEFLDYLRCEKLLAV